MTSLTSREQSPCPQVLLRATREPCPSQGTVQGHMSRLCRKPTSDGSVGPTFRCPGHVRHIQFYAICLRTAIAQVSLPCAQMAYYIISHQGSRLLWRLGSGLVLMHLSICAVPRYRCPRTNLFPAASLMVTACRESQSLSLGAVAVDAVTHGDVGVASRARQVVMRMKTSACEAVHASPSPKTSPRKYMRATF